MNPKSHIVALLLSAPVIIFLGWYGYVTITSLAGGASGPMAEEAFRSLKPQDQLQHLQEVAAESPVQTNIDRLFWWIEENPTDPGTPEAYALLGDLRIRSIFSTEPAEFKVPHLVVPGDSLRSLSLAQNTTPGAIMRANNLLADTLQPGQRILLPKLNTNAVIHLAENRLVLYQDGKFLQSYPIEDVRIPEETLAQLPILTGVNDKPSVYAGETVLYGDPAYLKSSRRITLDDTPIVIYSNSQPVPETGSPATETEGTSEPSTADFTGPGIQLSRAHMEEVFLLLTGQSRVKIAR